MSLIATQEDFVLVPRYEKQGYGEQQVHARRQWLEELLDAPLGALGEGSIPTEAMRGNIENPIGCVQMPLGVAGPMLVLGQHANGTIYVPLATTEGALVRSYERGMVTTARSGGVTVRVLEDENCIMPVFRCSSLVNATELVSWLNQNFTELSIVANRTTEHGKLLSIEPAIVGKEVFVRCRFDVGDAHGMNMITKAATAVCHLVMSSCDHVRDFMVTTGGCSEKRASGALFAGGKGKRVIAEAVLTAAVLSKYLRVSPESMLEMWQSTFTAQVHSNTTGYNGHFANALTALFIALGQDVANVANSAVGITTFAINDTGDLYLSVTLPSITVATVGGGTGLPTSQACLGMLGCQGTGKALRLAEIVGATVLCGELSMGAAIASGEFSNAHEKYGRNRPDSPSEMGIPVQRSCP